MREEGVTEPAIERLSSASFPLGELGKLVDAVHCEGVRGAPTLSKRERDGPGA